MLRAKDISYLRKTRATNTPVRITGVGSTGTVWVGTVTSIQPSPVPLPTSRELLSFTISDLPDLRYQLLRPIPVVVETAEGCVVASFNEANIHSSGDTMGEAVTNLKSYIGDVFDEFLALGPDALGAGPRGDFAVLRSYLQKRNVE